MKFFNIEKSNLFELCIGNKLKDINIDRNSLLYLYIKDSVTSFLPSNKNAYNSIIHK